MNTEHGYRKQVESHHQGSKHTLAILMSKLRSSLGAAWEQARSSLERYCTGGQSPCAILVRCLRTASSQPTNCQFAAYGLFRILLLLFVLLGTGIGSVWGQTKVSDGIYYIRNNGTNQGYLWPSVTTNATSGYRYLTTSLDTSAPAVTNNNGVSYPAHDKSYSHWVVKNVTGGYIQLINPRLNKYVVLRSFPKANNTKAKSYGDRDVWLTDEPAAEDVEYSYFVLNNNNSPYKISPKPKLNDVATTSGYSFNSASGDDRVWLTWSKSDNKPQNEEGREGLIQLFSGGTPLWSFTPDLLDAPTIVYDSDNDKFIISYAKIPAGFKILYTIDGSDPSSTVGGSTMEYTNESAITLATIGENPLKAVVVRYGLILTETAILRKPTNPTITQTPGDCNNTVTISAGEGTSIYYTIDGTTPTNSSTLYTVPFVLNSDATIKAVAYSGNLHSEVISFDYTPNYSNKPSITQNGATITITGSGTIYYTTNGSDPDTGCTLYDGPFTLSGNSGDLITVKAVAKNGEKELSCVVEKTVTMGYFISNLSQLQAISSHLDELCFVTSDIDASTLSSSISGFTGVFDGGYYTISGLTKPLFDNLNGATVKNVLLDPNATVSGDGAICNEAEGTTKIYNCGVLSGEISGSDNVGGLVGHIKSGSNVRVVNCYNYANVSGSDYAAGIVGYNEGTVGNVRIAMCMMYGSVSDATNISPVYGGNHTTNAQNFTEYNYYLFSNERNASGDRIVKIPYTAYNDQLAIDNDVYLTRFPFYRYILNNHRELASYFLFGDYDSNHIEELGHWVKKKGDNAPKYPIVEKWEVNRKSTPTQTNNNLPNTTEDYAGKLLTTMGNSGYLSVSIKIGNKSYSTSLPITDMDTLRFDYNYGKVILPFANEYEINTDYSRICTGWKITGVTGGTAGTITNYNFADRNCTAKDIYNESTNPFIFAQGGYYIVPTGVTGISIEANFATAYYLSDATYEIGYTSAYAGRTGLGGDVPTQFHGRTVYNSLATAVTNLATSTTNPHKQAIVLVGNYHYDLAKGDLATTSGFTLMSIDADNNQEPDYGFYSIAPDRPQTPALRFDFVPIIPLGMAAKVNGSNYYPGIPIWNSRGWYEQTETTVSIMNQFELDSGNFTKDEKDYEGKGQNPCIINGGYFVQMIRSRNTNCSKVSYFKIGGNAYIKEFYPGSHSSNAKNTTIVPVNVTGGQVDECYMTGYKSGAKAIGTDIRFWCSGGKIGKFLGAYMDEPWETSEAKGNVNMTAQVDHALIGRFFGGGTSPSAAITGDINVTINNSKVDFYCGGPEFGDMISGKVVTTNANNTTFGEYYGAGFGGTAITYNPVDYTPPIGQSVTFPSSRYTYGSSRLKNSGSLGLATCYKFEYLMHSADKNKLVARFITGYANFNLATTGNVTNNLTGCTIEKDFYGAGCQGKVNGKVTSTLTSCTLKGSAFGGGYKAVSNEVKVYPAAAPTLSTYYGETGLFSEFGTTEPETYTWEQGTGTNPTADEGHHKLKTSSSVTMTELGNVTGSITLNIDDGTTVAGSVFGGGNESKSLNNAIVNVIGGTITHDVYGGGNKADVNGDTQVNLLGGIVNENVYGGGRGTDGTNGIAALVGNTFVNLNGMDASEYKEDYSSWGMVSEGDGKPYTVSNTAKGCVVGGSIFGCNNINGSPKGDATVHVYKTQNADASQIGNDNNVTTAKRKGNYDVTAVYGGGNLAPFIPAAANESTASTHVIIDGCDLTSIETVYGGGNAASTPATNVTVNGTYEINELFGGGNGKDRIPKGGDLIENPGANVGYTNYSTYDQETDKWIDNPDADTKEERLESDYLYGSGAANVNIYGGTIHQVFGGSNMKGNVRISAVTLLDDNNDCEFCVDEAYGGGKSAPMDAEAKLLMSCIPGLKAAYGGAEAANIEGDVTLNITNGTFDRVFGGNNKSGRIGGTITVNIEETGCKPVIIGQLYGGGNQAPYTAPFVKDDEGKDTDVRQHGPTLNIKSFTSIGEVYGGGYGEGAVVTGDTYVNINEVVGDKSSQDEFMKETVTDVTDPATQTTGTDKVSKNTGVTKTFKDGDGDDANTISVDIPLHKKGDIGSIGVVFGGGNAAQVVGNTHVNIGTLSSVDYVTKASGESDARTGITPVGADIRGNVYGGGNNAEVTGNANVTIGKKVE